MSAHQHMDVVMYLEFEKNRRYQRGNREIIESGIDTGKDHGTRI